MTTETTPMPKTTRDIFDAALRGKCISEEEHALLCKGLGDDGYLIHPTPSARNLRADPEVVGVHMSLRGWLNMSAVDVGALMLSRAAQSAYVRADDLGKVLALHTALPHTEPLFRWSIDGPAKQVPHLVASLYESDSAARAAIRTARETLGLPAIPQ